MEEPISDTREPAISFVVPAHDEELLLPRTLASIHAAARAATADYEIIVVDDASTDATADVAIRHGARLVRVDHRKISATRNSGGRAARGRYLIFVDADTCITARTVEAAIRAMRDGAAGGGSGVGFEGDIPAYARLMLPVMTAAFRYLRIGAGCFLFCTRSAFLASGGFDETLFCSEEIAFSAALKKSGRFVVLRERVETSGRKLRAYSGRELLVQMGRLVLDRYAMKRRDGLDFWYGPRRTDPAAPASATKQTPAPDDR